MFINEPLNNTMMKQIAHEIIEDEEKKWNIKLNIYPFTFIEYYTSDIFKKRFKLRKLDSILLPFNANGINDMRGNSIIFLNNYSYYIKSHEKLFNFLFTCYHEYRHSIQQYFEFNTYDAFLFDIDHFLRSLVNFDYDFEHDKYSHEIGANLYGVRRASEYMIKYYPELYEKNKTKIEKIEQQYLYDYMTFDTTDLIERTMRMLKINSEIQKNNLVSKIGEKSNISLIKKIDITEVPVVLQLFLNDDFSFKSIKEIIRRTKIHNIDKRIIYHVLSCNSFLTSVNIKELSNEELELLNDSLQYTYTVYENQKRYVEKTNGKAKENSNVINMIANKMKDISKFVDEQLRGLLNFSRDEWKRQNNIMRVAEYLEESESLISRRRV